MTEPSVPSVNLTPVMRQYRNLKSKNPDALLFFRLGDFYELFEEDARRAAPILELVLTQRQGVPMCGFPHHAFSGYLGKLLKQGLRVAVAEQMEDPSAAKGMVARDVVRIVSPGTVLEEELLSAKENNFLAAVWPSQEKRGAGLAWADMSTGEFRYARFGEGDSAVRRLADELGRISPREILWPEGVVAPLGRTVTSVPSLLFMDEGLDRRAETLFRVSGMAGFGLAVGHPARPAVAALLSYVEKNQASALGALRPPQVFNLDEFMVLDEGAIRRLDLLPEPGARPTGVPTCLWNLIDITATAMGGRRLNAWLLRPLMDRKAIGERQDRVEYFFNARRERKELQTLLRETADLERILSRLTAGTVTGRDLSALRRTIRLAPEAGSILSESVTLTGDHPLGALSEAFHVPPELRDLLESALADAPPMRLAEGGVIREGYSAALDELRALASQGRGWISGLEAEEREKTSIGSLKIGFTSVFGYYLEVSKSNLGKVPSHWIRKQTLVNAERYVTPELKAQEEKILGADEKALALERELLAELRDRVLAHRESLFRLAEALGQSDALAALAESAERGRWVRPEITDADVFVADQSRHPVVERVLESRGGGAFVPNDIYLDDQEERLLLVTGPNMGGKSTYLRQAALTAVLAQMGSFVPAAKARLGLVDRIFTRIGAGDDLAGGASTFMVEMREVADILLNATSRSLVILDEVGRGTSTYDGLAVAWATAEWLAGTPERLGPKVLFATHYFELTELAHLLPRVKNHHAAVREWTRPDGKSELVFLHQILSGPADRSYGVHVAQMAGLPAGVVTRARELLKGFEAGRRIEHRQAPKGQRDLFSDHPAIEALRALNPNGLTPLAALQALDELKRKLEGDVRGA
ncbi:MAG: DNA mismatch repair protein MutS [Elusimicrobia bacterium]|jgi:DNA mismatch repair protein MutS|nr:DNA mismatch repair protein MutS [Elusimicrobiota bacterium]